MKEYVIPVAFEVSTEDDAFSEADAASWLCTALAGCSIPGIKLNETSMIGGAMTPATFLMWDPDLP